MEASRRQPAYESGHARGGSQQATASRREQEVNISKVVKVTCTDGSFELSNFSIFQTFKLSNFVTVKLSNLQSFGAVFKLSNFCMLDGSWFMVHGSTLMAHGWGWTSPGDVAQLIPSAVDTHMQSHSKPKGLGLCS